MPLLTNKGLPLAADITAVMDALSRAMRSCYSQVGIGAPSESSTLAYYAGAIRDLSLSNSDLKQSVVDFHSRFMSSYGRYDALIGGGSAELINGLDNLCSRYWPSTWARPSLRMLDAHLTRINATSALQPATPSYTVTLTATTGGSIAPTTGGSEPRCKITLVGSSDIYESLPTAASAQVALSGKNNAYTLGGLTGNVPTGVTKLRVYRQLNGNAGSSDPYYWDQDVAVTAGVAWSTYTVTLTKADSSLVQYVQPPSWAQALATPEFAAIYLMMYVSRAGDALVTIPSATSMMSACNVANGPINDYLGLVNPESTGLFATWASASTTVGSPQTANSYSQALQGFLGAYGARVRVTGVLNAAGTITINYSYKDSSNPITPTTATFGPTSISSTAVGTLLDLSLTAGRVLTSISSITGGGGLSTGTFVVEGKQARSL